MVYYLYGKPVFTKQVLNKSDKQFEKIYWFYSEGKTDTKIAPESALCSGMPSLLDAYLELNGPKVMVFHNMMMQCAISELIHEIRVNSDIWQNSWTETLQSTSGRLRGRTSRPYSHILVILKPHTPDALRYRTNTLQLDRQTVYVIGAVPT